MDWRSIPSLSALRAYEATARLRSFSKAAAELNVTHAAISQHVRALESEFGEALVYRQGRGLALTDKGLEFATSLRTGFSEIETAVSNLRSYQDGRPINISITPAFATHWLMPRIGDFWARYPNITININPSTTLVDLIKDNFDITIRYGSGDWPNLNIEHLLGGDFCVVARPDILANRDISCLQDVTDIPWLLEGYMMERRALLEAEGVDLENANVKHFKTNEMVLAALKAGLGMSVQPQAMIQHQIDEGSLKNVCELDQQGLSYYILTRKDRAHKDLKVFVQWLREMAEQ